MVPDFESLMYPVLNSARNGEVGISDVVRKLEEELNLSDEDRSSMLPSGKQTRFSNRVNWAKSYLKQAGLVESASRGRFNLTETGRKTLDQSEKVDIKYLERYPKFIEYRKRTKTPNVTAQIKENSTSSQTPDEVLRAAFKSISDVLSADLLERVTDSKPEFFEQLIVELLLKMGYGTDDESGHVIGQRGDDGVDGVINQDSLGVDQVYVQAKRYAASNKVGAGAIRDFYGALDLKDVKKGIFFTTSTFSPSATETAQKLGARIVLIDGFRLAQLMIRFEVGCRIEQVISLAKLDEGYFET
jgi:restriction system protein